MAGAGTSGPHNCHDDMQYITRTHMSPAESASPENADACRRVPSVLAGSVGGPQGRALQKGSPGQPARALTLVPASASPLGGRGRPLPLESLFGRGARPVASLRNPPIAPTAFAIKGSSGLLTSAWPWRLALSPDCTLASALLASLRFSTLSPLCLESRARSLRAHRGCLQAFPRGWGKCPCCSRMLCQVSWEVPPSQK